MKSIIVRVFPYALLSLVVPTLHAACGGGQVPACNPGDQIDCDCGNNVTLQATCLADGSGYGDCPCSNVGTGGNITAGSGGAAGTSGAGGNAGTTSSTGTATYNCVATCCSGPPESSNQSSEQDCKFYGGFACQSKNGPSKITYNNNNFWSAPSGCPSMKDCAVNCCDGTIKSQGKQFDGDLCAFYGVEDHLCGSNGNTAKVFFNGNSVWTNAANDAEPDCGGNCKATCCGDGNVKYSNEADYNQCKFWTGGYCIPMGGPTTVQYGGDTKFSSPCPSNKSCKVVCVDNAEDSHPEWDADVCNLILQTGSFCNGHGGIKGKYFDGQQLP